MPSVSPSILSAWLAPLLSNLYVPVSSPCEFSTGSLCMHRSTTVMSLLMTHSRSSPVFRIAFLEAMIDNSSMRALTAGTSDSHRRTFDSDRSEPMAFHDSCIDMPIARALQ